MKFSDETVMAYADGELDAPMRAAMEAAMVTDDELARRVAQYQGLRTRLRSTFDPVLDEPLPDGLLDAARGAPLARRPDNVIPLSRTVPPRWSWPQWGAPLRRVLSSARCLACCCRGRPPVVRSSRRADGCCRRPGAGSVAATRQQPVTRRSGANRCQLSGQRR